MELYVIAGVVIVVVGAITSLGVLMYKLSRSNRSDLRELVQTTKDTSDAKRDNDGYKRSVEDLEHALEERTAELARERAALDAAHTALGRAHKKLATSGDADSVAVDINRTLERLSKMSDVSSAAPTEDDDD